MKLSGNRESTYPNELGGLACNAGRRQGRATKMSNFGALVCYPGESSGSEGELDWGRVVPFVDAAAAATTETAAAAVGGTRGDVGGTGTGAVAGTGAAAGTVLGD